MNLNDIANMANQVGIKLNGDHGSVTEFSADELQKLINHLLDSWRFDTANMVEQMGIDGYGTLAIASAIRSKHVADKTLGAFIRANRHYMGMSQMMLAKALNVSQGTIGFWEKGLTSPTIKNTKLLSELFNVSHVDLINLLLKYKESKTND